MVTDVGCDGIALNFRPVSNIGQSINYIHPWVQEIQAFKNIYQKLFEQPQHGRQCRSSTCTFVQAS